MFLMTKAGRRGCVWGLVVCPYWGRQHSIMKRVRKASNFERLVISVRFVPVYQLHLLQKPCKEEVCHCPSDASRSIAFSSFSFWILPCLMPKSSKTSQAVPVPVSSLHWAYLYFFDCAFLPLLSESNAPSVIHQNVLTGLYALIYIYKYRWSFLYFYYFYYEHKTNNNVQLTLIWHWLAAVQQE